MNLKILSLNCQWAYNQEVKKFLQKILETDFYDFLLLQEANADVLTAVQKFKDYKQLGAFNTENQKQSWLHILYKKKFILKHSSFISFSQLNLQFSQYPQLGFLVGTFQHNEEIATLGSLHLHPGYDFRLRVLESNMIKKHILATCDPAKAVIFGGDFNTGLPFESWRIRKILSPEFYESTKNNGSTLHSRYTQKGTHIIAKTANLLAAAGINISFRTDKIFVDQKTARQCKSATRVLPDHVSDHSPVELILG